LIRWLRFICLVATFISITLCCVIFLGLSSINLHELSIIQLHHRTVRILAAMLHIFDEPTERLAQLFATQPYPKKTILSDLYANQWSSFFAILSFNILISVLFMRKVKSTAKAISSSRLQLMTFSIFFFVACCYGIKTSTIRDLMTFVQTISSRSEFFVLFCLKSVMKGLQLMSQCVLTVVITSLYELTITTLMILFFISQWYVRLFVT
jgi:hypothetical protein